MIQLDIWLDRNLIGHLTHDARANRFHFAYTEAWKQAPRCFPISPQLPLEPPPAQTPEAHSTQVRQFFENLLPEGEALDHAAQAAGTSKSNLVGLLIALGKETAGAVRVEVPAASPAGGIQSDRRSQDGLRPITPEELSERIRKRAEVPFSVWDGQVRLSIAGYQDKIAVYENEGRWYLVNDERLASTVIVKPVPTNPNLASLPANEFMCMQLAQRVGLTVAATRLVEVPEQVLLVTRFDRAEERDRVQRLHVIDGCQALGMPVFMKYEQAYGEGVHVRHIRDGVSFAKLFKLLEQSPQPARDKQALLRWAIFQILIGNTDAHGKNVSFFYDIQGLRLAPAYDLVCMPALAHQALSQKYAMAVGDAFDEASLSPFEWAHFAHQCGLPFRLVSNTLRDLSLRVLDELKAAKKQIVNERVPVEVADAVATTIAGISQRQFALAPGIAKFNQSDFK